MGTYLKIILISLLLVVLQHLVRVIYLLGFHKVVYNHTPGPCTIVKGVDFGSEDIATLADGKAFITSGLRQPIDSSHVREFLKDNNVKGRIHLFDFNKPKEDPIDLEIRGDFNRSNFWPHGIGHWHDSKTGRTVLFVVSHGVGQDSIEKFEYTPGQTHLQHLHTYTDRSMMVVNDVAAVGENRFYFTNYLRFRTEFMSILEAFLILPLGNVNYFDGKEYDVVADGFTMPNGLALSHDYKYLYLAASGTRNLKVFRRHETGAISFIEEFQIHTGPDNPTVEPFTGNVLVGAHPISHEIAAHLINPVVPAPSQVLMFNAKDGHLSNMTELYSNDGSRLWGSTVASLYKTKMLIGTVHHKLMYCEVLVL